MAKFSKLDKDGIVFPGEKIEPGNSMKKIQSIDYNNFIIICSFYNRTSVYKQTDSKEHI
jgi:hypothetical protein